MLEYLELFFGKSYTGKTARMLHEIRNEPRVVLVDPKCAQLVDLKGFDHFWLDGFIPGKNQNPGTWPAGDNNPSSYFRAFAGSDAMGRPKKFRVVIHVREHFTGQLNSLCLLMRAVRNLVLAVDELGLFIPAGSAARLPAAITTAMVSGSHEGLIFCGTAQIPSLVHFIAKSNASRIRWFRVDEKNSIADALIYMPRELVDSLPSLPDYVCIETSDKAPAFRDESMVGKIKILGARALEKTPQK